ncbi:unnamed protein product [Kuraishia capsulata CBS 1993]|uniref:Nuclear pore protein n=1 Tax=Kuraishia capsulata CBS 1993 TaxID=1382522 RepID=W6MIB9_9ASCO|nr:uncharacterized protein KUCA_T00000042001 [Kuraishia capsulata CBS 1993]CDK24082.1 unnamed protein product [Kuraishia capsulata CBS 1993]
MPTGSAFPPAPKASLKELLESAKNLPKRSSDIGTVNLGPNEIRRKANELRGDKSEDRHYTKAHYLLAGSGITLEEIESEIQSINVRQFAASPAPGANQTPLSQQSDVDNYISAKKDENILAAIEQSLATAAKDFDMFVNQNITMDWKQRKEALRESFSVILNRGSSGRPSKQIKTAEDPVSWGGVSGRSLLSSKNDFADVKPSSAQPSRVVNPTTSFAIRQRFETFAQAVYDLNESRQQRKPYPICTVFSDITKFDQNVKSRHVHDSWKILVDFVEESNSAGLKERKYEELYCSGDSLDFQAIAFRKLVVSKSRTYLEDQFMDYLNDFFVQTGSTSVPTNVEKVSVFLEHKLKRGGDWNVPNLSLINGVPIWALIFYLLRAGCLEDAIQVTEKYHDSFKKLEKSFPVYLKSYHKNDRQFGNEMQGRITNEFNQYFKHINREADPFRYAVYKIIGRCDLSKKSFPYISLSIEDWVWIHLSLVRENDIEDDPIHERYSLIDFQRSILSFGVERFNASSNHPMYLQVLLLTGQYEEAVHYLFSVNEMDSVHLAIALSYYGLLNVTGKGNELMSVEKTKKIFFARLIGLYVSSFKISDPRVAAEYLILISLNQSDEQVNLSLSVIRELVLDTREFVLLLGKIDKDGNRIPGIIEERKSLLKLDDEASFLHKISEQAALKAEEEGRYYDCILLYQLSEEYDMVISLVNKLLGELLNTTEISYAPLLEDQSVALATKLMKIYNRNSQISDKVSLKSRETCSKLLEIIKIREQYEAKAYSKCLKSIMDLGLVPNAGSDLETIRFLSQQFNTLDESISKNIPGLLIITMTITRHLLLDEMKSGLNNDKSEHLRQISRNCLVYAGILQFKMPREVYTTLVNLECV